jgi:hypothetical protein
MTAIRPLVAAVVLSSLLAVPVVAARDYTYLKDVFEGRRVTVRIDMPATSDGVNVHVDSRRGLDVNEYRNNLRRYGVAIREGESVMVTLVKVKSDLIEFQLGGGGYGTFFDDTDTSANIPYIGKSDRERSLERQVRDETDRNRRRQLERELDVLRDRRERENHRIRIERERISEYKEERLAFRRLQAGSRFNIRFRDRVPYDLRPEDITDALAQYVDFDGRRRR